MELTNCRDISIYMGNVCNFNCHYCDRDYIEGQIGGQRLRKEDAGDIVKFIQAALGDGTNDTLQMLSFHGGEPFVYASVMEHILEHILSEVPGDYPIFIQTNGSLLLDNRKFLEKYADRLMISISYDFLFQELNRTKFAIRDTLAMLHDLGIWVQMQHVIPIDDPRAFSLQAIKNIADTCMPHGVNKINLIPLRHIRGLDRFRTIVSEVDLKQMFSALLRYVQHLYVLGFHVSIDGHNDDDKFIDKAYFGNHKQLVLSPDGYIYPEYDFLEYQFTDARIGQWKGNIDVYRDEDNFASRYSEECTSCSSFDKCGIKYLYAMFDMDPHDKESCKTFYEMIDVAIKHVQKMHQKPTLFHWIGI